MKRVLFLISLAMASPSPALELTLTGQFDLNYPASLYYDPSFCGLWIANEGPEVILITLDGLELRRISSDLSRIKAISVEGNNLIVADGLGQFQRITKNGGILEKPFRISSQWADTEGITIDEDGNLSWWKMIPSTSHR